MAVKLITIEKLPECELNTKLQTFLNSSPIKYLSNVITVSDTINTALTKARENSPAEVAKVLFQTYMAILQHRPVDVEKDSMLNYITRYILTTLSAEEMRHFTLCQTAAGENFSNILANGVCPGSYGGISGHYHTHMEAMLGINHRFFMPTRYSLPTHTVESLFTEDQRTKYRASEASALKELIGEQMLKHGIEHGLTGQIKDALTFFAYPSIKIDYKEITIALVSSIPGNLDKFTGILKAFHEIGIGLPYDMLQVVQKNIEAAKTLDPTLAHAFANAVTEHWLIAKGYGSTLATIAEIARNPLSREFMRSTEKALYENLSPFCRTTLGAGAAAHESSIPIAPMRI